MLDLPAGRAARRRRRRRGGGTAGRRRRAAVGSSTGSTGRTTTPPVGPAGARASPRGRRRDRRRGRLVRRGSAAAGGRHAVAGRGRRRTGPTARSTGTPRRRSRCGSATSLDDGVGDRDPVGGRHARLAQRGTRRASRPPASPPQPVLRHRRGDGGRGRARCGDPHASGSLWDFAATEPRSSPRPAACSATPGADSRFDTATGGVHERRAGRPRARRAGRAAAAEPRTCRGWPGP